MTRRYAEAEGFALHKQRLLWYHCRRHHHRFHYSLPQAMLLGEKGIPMAAIRILIAEDNELVALTLEEQLKGLGYDVIGVARTGAEAIDLASRLSPDLIIMDIRMPEVEGTEAAARINQQRPVPILMLTASRSCALVAQWIEQRFPKPEVSRSNRLGGTTLQSQTQGSSPCVLAAR